MPKGRLISRDPVRRVSTWLEVEPDGSYLFTQVQDVRGLQSRITEEANDWNPSFRRPNTQKHETKVAEIPLVIVNRLMQQGIWGDDKKMRQWLNDPDNRSFRSGGGKV
jgi:hypothetical protein